MNGEFADISAWEKNGIDNITVCCECNSSVSVFQDGTVFQITEYWIVEMLEKELTYQLLAGETTTAVVE